MKNSNGFKVQGEIQNSLWMGAFREKAPTYIYHLQKHSKRIARNLNNFGQMIHLDPPLNSLLCLHSKFLRINNMLM